MDENTQVMTEEATMPTEPVTEPADDTQPAEPTAEAPEETGEEVTTPPTDPAEDADAPPAPFLPVKFRHEHRDLSREEATAYAQMGLLYEAEQPTRDKIALLAAGRGQSVQEFVDSLVKYDEKTLLDEKRRITGGNEEEAQKLFRVDMEARQNACAERVRQAQEADQQAEQSLTDRLAAEYGELREEIPEIGEFATIPRDVVNDAVRNGRHLLDAYLRYQRRESKKIEQNRAAQASAQAASTGSLTDSPPEGGMDAATAAMMKAVWDD